MSLPCGVPVLLLSVFLATCSKAPAPGDARPAVLHLSSPALDADGAIAERFTCAGLGVSPPLAWSAPPAATRSLALVLERLPDGEPLPGRRGERQEAVVLWIVYNLPPALRGVPENLLASPDLAAYDPPPSFGVNHFGTAGYDGPCPSLGRPGLYVFRLFALDAVLPDHAGLSRQALYEAMAGHVLAMGTLQGLYPHSPRLTRLRYRYPSISRMSPS